MKIKSLLLFLCICCTIILVPNCVLAANSEGIYTEYDGNGNIVYKYELFDDNTATILYIGEKNLNIPLSVDANGKTYSITKMGKDSLNGLTQEQELCIFLENAPILEEGISFDKIKAIYIPQLNTQGYTEENGWPIEKLKNHKITVQPVSPANALKAGNITSADTLSIKAEVPTGGFLAYSWYFCDEKGNITEEEPVGDNSNIFQIPIDLNYDNQTGQAKEYYFKCVLGTSLTIRDESDVVKVVVEPGDYKVSFYNSTTSKESLVLLVNDERKLSQTDIDKIPTEEQLQPYKEGETFIGWTTDGITIYNVKDLETKIFEKNTKLYPLWKTKLNLDANGGKFSDGKTIFTTYRSNFNMLDEELSLPTLEGEEFLGFFYDKSGGVPYEGEKLTKETTLYAQWLFYSVDKDGNIDDSSKDKNSGNVVEDNKNTNNITVDTNSESNGKNNTTTGNEKNNPNTGDKILLFVGLLVVSLIGIFTTTKYKANTKK